MYETIRKHWNLLNKVLYICNYLSFFKELCWKLFIHLLLYQAFCIYILFGNQVPTYEGNQSFNIYEAAMSTGLLMEKKKTCTEVLLSEILLLNNDNNNTPCLPHTDDGE